MNKHLPSKLKFSKIIVVNVINMDLTIVRSLATLKASSAVYRSHMSVEILFLSYTVVASFNFANKHVLVDTL